MSFAIQSSHFYVQPNAEIAKQIEQGSQEQMAAVPVAESSPNEPEAFSSIKSGPGNIALSVKETNTAVEDFY